MAERPSRRSTRRSSRAAASKKRSGRGTGLLAKSTATRRGATQRQGTRSKGRHRAVARHPASDTPTAKRPMSPRVRRRRAVLRTMMLGLGLIGLLFAFVYPTSTFLHQHARLDAGEAQIAKLAAQTKQLERQNAELRGDAAVERIAREEYGLVRPGETPYVIVPSAPTSTTAPKASSTTTSSTKAP